MPNITFVIPPHFDTCIQTQRNSDFYAYVGENYVASVGLYTRTDHHGNMDGKDDDDSQSLETPQKNNSRSSSFGDTISTKTTPQLSKLHTTGKKYLCFRIEGGVSNV